MDRVRDGNGCFPSAIATGNIDLQNCTKPKVKSSRLISTGQLKAFPLLRPRPIYLVFFKVPYPFRVGDLILPTSRCQTSPSMWTLGGDQPVIPGVAFIR